MSNRGPPETIYCQQCGQELRADAQFCDRCGSEQPRPVQQQQSHQQQSGWDTPQGGQTQQSETFTEAVGTGAESGESDLGSKIGKASLVVIVLFVGAIVIASFVLGLGDATGPDSAVEEYWGALDDGDIEDAQEHAADKVASDLESGGITASMLADNVDISASNIDILSESESSATVDANVKLSNSDGSVTYQVRHDLEKRNGDWVITSTESQIVDAGN